MSSTGIALASPIFCRNLPFYSCVNLDRKGRMVRSTKEKNKCYNKKGLFETRYFTESRNGIDRASRSPMKSRKKKIGIEKRIGVKYCGGCNPTYNRIQVIRQLRSCFLNRFYFVPSNRKTLNGLLFINGCQRSCAVENGKGLGSFSISGENELPLLIHWLTKLEEKENS